MKALIQRVKRASVTVDQKLIADIGQGYLILLGVAASDTKDDLVCLVRKTAKLRIFADDEGKMNRAITDIGGEILVVSQFTLCANARQGNRPAFTSAMPPLEAEAMYLEFCELLRAENIPVATGQFGATMDVSLINDGPVTIMLESRHGSLLD